MAGIRIDHEKCTLCGACEAGCPFRALERANGRIEVNAACRLCKLCLKQCPAGAITLEEAEAPVLDKSEWSGALVFAEMTGGALHPVTLELIGKARELMAQVGQKVHCVCVGEGIAESAGSLTDYGLDQILVYDDSPYRYFTADVYADAFADAVNRLKPSVVLVGATAVGRSLAPRLSTRFRTGLTADCTSLEIKPDGDLVQIRPAFGGDIMARIITPRTRPQFATVRYKTMDRATRLPGSGGTVVPCAVVSPRPRVEVLELLTKPLAENISEAEIIVAGGRGLKREADLDLLRRLADALGGQLASTRPLIEAGWLPYTRQIGLSGRTVKPRLIITCGVSGAVQFTACMKESDLIIAINQDKNAPIFKIAHYGIVGDLYQVVPRLIGKIKGQGGRA